MKTSLITALCLALTGCSTLYGTEPWGANAPTAGELIRGASIDKALLVQRTLYPYHFVLDGSELNALGERDLMVLAAHFRKSPGQLRVHRGDAPPALHEARMRAVMAALAADGVDAAQMKLSEGFPGGDGLPSERVIVILANQNPLGTTSSGSSGSSAAPTGGLGMGSSGSY
jgi:hypothetical protein